jgi:hypothetical protein
MLIRAIPKASKTAERNVSKAVAYLPAVQRGNRAGVKSMQIDISTGTLFTEVFVLAEVVLSGDHSEALW